MSEDGLRISNAAEYKVIAIVHKDEADKTKIESLTLELGNLVKFQTQWEKKIGNNTVREVLPGMAKIFPATSIPFRKAELYVTILASMDGSADNITWICINYTPPLGRCIIIRPDSSFVLAKQGYHWTEETGGYCHNKDKEVSSCRLL